MRAISLLLATLLPVLAETPPSLDGTPAQEDALYRRLLREAPRPGAPGERVAAATLASAPDAWRGRAVLCKGVILGDPAPCRIRLHSATDGRPAVSTVDGCEAVVVDPVSGDRILALFIAPGPAPAAHGRIEFTGLFWKIASWKNRRGEAVTAPYVIARTWRLAPSGEPVEPAYLMLAVPGGIVVASVLIGLLANRRQRACNDWIPSDN